MGTRIASFGRHYTTFFNTPPPKPTIDGGSPEDSSFKATFEQMELTECKWLAHDGQALDEDI